VSNGFKNKASENWIELIPIAMARQYHSNPRRIQQIADMKITNGTFT